MQIPQVNPGDDVVLAVEAADGQYHIDAVGLHQDPWPTPTAGLFNGEAGWIAVLCGISWGPVSVRVQYVSDSPPPVQQDWDMVGERDLVVDDQTSSLRDPHRTVISQIYTEPAAQIVTPPGRYRVRIHVKDRAEAHQRNDTDTAVERHLLQLWPTANAQPPTIHTPPDTYAQQAYNV